MAGVARRLPGQTHTAPAVRSRCVRGESGDIYKGWMQTGQVFRRKKSLAKPGDVQSGVDVICASVCFPGTYSLSEQTGLISAALAQTRKSGFAVTLMRLVSADRRLQTQDLSISITDAMLPGTTVKNVRFGSILRTRAIILIDGSGVWQACGRSCSGVTYSSGRRLQDHRLHVPVTTRLRAASQSRPLFRRAEYLPAGRRVAA